jgi:hypothetical protein
LGHRNREKCLSASGPFVGATVRRCILTPGAAERGLQRRFLLHQPWNPQHAIQNTDAKRVPPMRVATIGQAVNLTADSIEAPATLCHCFATDHGTATVPKATRRLKCTLRSYIRQDFPADSSYEERQNSFRWLRASIPVLKALTEILHHQPRMTKMKVLKLRDGPATPTILAPNDATSAVATARP